MAPEDSRFVGICVSKPSFSVSSSMPYEGCIYMVTVSSGRPPGISMWSWLFLWSFQKGVTVRSSASAMFVENCPTNAKEEMGKGWYPIPTPDHSKHSLIQSHLFLKTSERSVHCPSHKFISYKHFKLLKQTNFLFCLKITLLYIMASTSFLKLKNN